MYGMRWRGTLGRNRTQEADGSIPFSSTELLSFWFRKLRLKRFVVQSFQTSERSGGESPSIEIARHAGDDLIRRIPITRASNAATAVAGMCTVSAMTAPAYTGACAARAGSSSCLSAMPTLSTSG